MDSQKLIERFGLEPHPEGGYFRETYRSPATLENLVGFEGPRSCSTGIYFLLTAESRSHLHRIKSDEMWHFYSGAPLKIVILHQSGEFEEVILGADIDKGQVFQYVVPAGAWFGAEVLSGGQFSFVGCTVAPGFDFTDFEMASFEDLQKEFPARVEFLKRFCLS
jgi:predicted cupin superfamily sugar epimerase